MKNKTMNKWITTILQALIAFAFAILMAKGAGATTTPYGDVPGRYNAYAVTWLIADCISARIQEIRSDAAAKLLTDSCFQDVLNGFWTKDSRAKYIKDHRPVED